LHHEFALGLVLLDFLARRDDQADDRRKVARPEPLA
jgi:hypothetical protein